MKLGEFKELALKQVTRILDPDSQSSTKTAGLIIILVPEHAFSLKNYAHRLFNLYSSLKNWFPPNGILLQDKTTSLAFSSSGRHSAEGAHDFCALSLNGRWEECLQFPEFPVLITWPNGIKNTITTSPINSLCDTG